MDRELDEARYNQQKEREAEQEYQASKDAEAMADLEAKEQAESNEPKLDESRLLTPEEIDAVWDKWEKKTYGDISKELGNTFTQSIAIAQLAKDMEWEDKRGFIKDAEYQVRLEELKREIEALFSNPTVVTFCRSIDHRKASVENCRLILPKEWQKCWEKRGVK